MVASKSFASLRLRPSQAKKRSTTQRRAWTAKPACPLALRTISIRIGLAWAGRSPAWAASA
jgi:hypothetical protein